MNRHGRVAALALAVLLAACGDAPVAPVAAPQFSAATQAKALGKLAKYRNGPPSITIAFATKAIGASGGTLSLAGFEVVVPPGAVTKTTDFTIRLPVDAQMSNFVWASFGPHGMQFNKPVTLKVPYQGTTADDDSSAHVMWFNGTDWIELLTTPTDDGRLQTFTNHFSDYGTEETTPARGLTPVGG